MNTWFECNAKYVNSEGKKVSENYLLDAMSFTEAESKIFKELETMVSGEFNVTGIKKSNIAEIIPSENGDKWFKSKISFISIDEVSGKEKRSSQYVLVLANKVDDAFENVVESFKDTMMDYEIDKVDVSNIVDVFPYEVEEEDCRDNAN